MLAEEGKKRILEILQQDLKFDGHFDKCFENIKETQQEELIIWVKDCKEHKTNVIQSKLDREIIGFVRRIGSNVRAILTKRKDNYFIVLFLDKHKYYEVEMLKLGF
ncbi:hypothetical protein J4437_03960 [Candidatus Woesearchaeota archaeon]|nr:hypothetical protein [uncultured archaeon]MBS3123766.1 hypothetical protein [Candidatus Woesearchaeota archaeon]